MGLLLATTSKGLIEMPLTFNYTRPCIKPYGSDRRVRTSIRFTQYEQTNVRIVRVTQFDFAFSHLAIRRNRYGKNPYPMLCLTDKSDSGR